MNLGPKEKFDAANPDHVDPKKYAKRNSVLEHVLAALRTNTMADPKINLAILLHDVGKTTTFEEIEGKMRYHGHAKEGVPIIFAIAERLKLDNETRDAIAFASENHMKFHGLLDMSNSKIVQLMNNKDWGVLYQVSYCDAKARGSMFDEVEWKKIDAKIADLKERYKDNEAKDRIKKAVSGKLVMDLLGLQPGKRVGEVVNATTSWILDNGINLNDTELIRQFILSQK